MITKEQLKEQIDQLPDEEVQGVYLTLRSKMRMEGAGIKAIGSHLAGRKKRYSVIQRFIAWLFGNFAKNRKRKLVIHDFQGRFDQDDIRVKAYE